MVFEYVTLPTTPIPVSFIIWFPETKRCFSSFYFKQRVLKPVLSNNTISSVPISLNMFILLSISILPITTKLFLQFTYTHLFFCPSLHVQWIKISILLIPFQITYSTFCASLLLDILFLHSVNDYSFFSAFLNRRGSTSVNIRVPANTRTAPIQCWTVNGFLKYTIDRMRLTNFLRVTTSVTVRALHSDVNINTDRIHMYLEKWVKECQNKMGKAGANVKVKTLCKKPKREFNRTYVSPV